MRILTVGLLLVLGGCASPLGGEELEVAAGLAGGPGIGPRVEFAQRMVTRPGAYDLHAEVMLGRQGLDPGEDARGRILDDDWTRFSGGLRMTFAPEEERHWFLRAGVSWVRALGDVSTLDRAGDHGGIHLGAGYRLRLTPHLSTGPDLTLLGLVPEGSGKKGGVVPQVAWTLVWHL